MFHKIFSPLSVAVSPHEYETHTRRIYLIIAEWTEILNLA